MGIKVTSSFDQQAALPLDSRAVQNDLASRDAIPSGVRFEGLTVYVIAAQAMYRLEGGITNSDWKILVQINDSIQSADTTYSSSKIQSLISGSLNYLGTWNAATNTPSISDATGNANDYYKVSVAGSLDLGSGAIAFTVGDDVIHNGIVWERIAAGHVVVVDDLTSLSSTDALSANMGRELNVTKEPTLPDGTGKARNVLVLDDDEITKVWQPTLPNAIEWQSGVMYSTTNMVTYDGFMYRALLTGTGHQPDISPTYWENVLLPEAPDDGKAYWRKSKGWSDIADYGDYT